MKKRGQALIVSLWILLMLTVITISIAHRTSIALRLNCYQRDRRKAVYLAKAGINRAIKIIESDTNTYDALGELWANNEEAFKKIVLDEKGSEFAAVSYQDSKEDSEPETIYGVIDEERRLNINTASEELLLTLLKESGIDQAEVENKVNNLLIWRGDKADDTKIYESLGYPPKGNKFSNLEELKLVKDITYDDYQRLRDSITVYGEGRVNINTASSNVLTALCRWAVDTLNKKGMSGINYAHADSLVLKIGDFRDGDDNLIGTQDDVAFTDANQIVTELKSAKGLSAEEETIINEIIVNFAVKSNNFLIAATGNVGKIKSKVSTVYKRGGGILYWHET